MPTPTSIPTKFSNFLYFGVGHCQDASVKYYDQVGLLVVVDSSGNQLRGTALLDFCSSWCGQNPNGLVRIEISEGPSTSECYCNFSDP